MYKGQRKIYSASCSTLNCFYSLDRWGLPLILGAQRKWLVELFADAVCNHHDERLYLQLHIYERPQYQKFRKALVAGYPEFEAQCTECDEKCDCLERVVVETYDMCARVFLDRVRGPSLRRNFEVPSAGAKLPVATAASVYYIAGALLHKIKRKGASQFGVSSAGQRAFASFGVSHSVTRGEAMAAERQSGAAGVQSRFVGLCVEVLIRVGLQTGVSILEKFKLNVPGGRTTRSPALLCARRTFCATMEASALSALAKRVPDAAAEQSSRHVVPLRLFQRMSRCCGSRQVHSVRSLRRLQDCQLALHIVRRRCHLHLIAKHPSVSSQNTRCLMHVAGDDTSQIPRRRKVRMSCAQALVSLEWQFQEMSIAARKYPGLYLNHISGPI